MKRNSILVLGWLALCIHAGLQAAETSPAADVPELAVLQNYYGTWDVKIADPNFVKGESTAQWILGGRFLEQRGTTEMQNGQRFEVKSLYTFDPERKKYRSWTFLSNGAVTECEMTWNANSKTMISTSQPSGRSGSFVVTADFSEKGKERWKFEFKDPQGNAVGEMRGENTQRSAEAPQRKQ